MNTAVLRRLVYALATAAGLITTAAGPASAGSSNRGARPVAAN